MPLPTNQFKTQARKAGRTIYWRVEAGTAGFFVAFFGLIGLSLISRIFWPGIITLFVALVVAAYVIRRVSSGRYQDLVCPTCGVRGEVVKSEHSYQFHCSRCNQTADTGVSAS